MNLCVLTNAMYAKFFKAICFLDDYIFGLTYTHITYNIYWYTSGKEKHLMCVTCRPRWRGAFILLDIVTAEDVLYNCLSFECVVGLDLIVTMVWCTTHGLVRVVELQAFY